MSQQPCHCGKMMLGVEDVWHNNFWSVNGKAVNPFNIKKVKIKGKVYTVVWKLKEGFYTDHGHKFFYETWEGYVEEPTFHTLVPLSELLSRYKIEVTEFV